MMQIIRHRRIWFTFSMLLVTASIVFIALGGIKPGIDFTGGTLIRFGFTGAVPAVADVENVLAPLDLGELRVQPADEGIITLRMTTIDNDQRDAVLEAVRSINDTVREDSLETIGPTIGKELRNRSFLAIVFVLTGIIIYIAWAFRTIKRTVGISSWSWGAAAIIALVHDVTIVVGVFAALGVFGGAEIDLLFVTALLTVLGFSVHDTIVVFDRIREHLIHGESMPFGDSVNVSVNETVTRSINTTSTTLFVLIALLLFGGSTLWAFVLALVVGMIIGTYSSIFLASPLLVAWEHRQNR